MTEYIDSILNYISPYVRRAWDGRLPHDWCLEERLIFDFEIVYIMEGEARVCIDGQEYTGTPGDVFFFRPNKIHAMKSVGETSLRQPHVHFDFFYQDDSEQVYVPVWRFTDYGEDIRFLRSDISGPSFLDIPNKLTLRDQSRFESILFKIIRQYECMSPYNALLLKSSMLELIAYFLEEKGVSEQSASTAQLPIENIERLEFARNYICDHVNQNITLDEISVVTGFSRNYFAKLFQDQYGISPMQFHKNLRIERAKQMLIFSEESITDIASSLGYNNIHTFSRAFKQSTHCNPSDFRSANANAADNYS